MSSDCVNYMSGHIDTKCDALQQKVPYGPCYKLLDRYYSVECSGLFKSSGSI